MTPHTDTDTRHVGRSGARVAGARVPETTTAAAPASSWDQRRAPASRSAARPPPRARGAPAGARRLVVARAAPGSSAGLRQRLLDRRDAWRRRRHRAHLCTVLDLVARVLAAAARVRRRRTG